MSAGKRDRWVELVPVTDSSAESDTGFPVETDEGSPEATIGLWAQREDISGRERLVMHQESAPFDTRWILPFGDAFDPDVVDVPKVFALRHKERRYDIVAARVVGRRTDVELLTLSRNG